MFNIHRIVRTNAGARMVVHVTISLAHVTVPPDGRGLSVRKSALREPTGLLVATNASVKMVATVIRVLGGAFVLLDGR